MVRGLLATGKVHEVKGKKERDEMGREKRTRFHSCTSCVPLQSWAY